MKDDYLRWMINVGCPKCVGKLRRFLGVGGDKNLRPGRQMVGLQHLVTDIKYGNLWAEHKLEYLLLPGPGPIAGILDGGGYIRVVAGFNRFHHALITDGIRELPVLVHDAERYEEALNRLRGQ